jgi:hypothetical protein
LQHRFRRPADVPAGTPANPVTDLRTEEFEILRDAVLVEHHRRPGERELALA